MAHRLLRIYGKEINIPADFHIMDAGDSKSLLQKFQKSILKI